MRSPRVAIVDGHLFTPAGIVHDTLLLEAGRIVAVGGADAEREGATVIDAAGGLVVPGFQDCHVHPVHAGLEMLACDLGGLSSREEYLARIRAYAEEHPAAAWITGGGWSMEAFPGGIAQAGDLDDVAPGRPVYLPSRDGHSAWVSTAALRAADITRDTPDPTDGRIERTPDGEPDGTLQEGAMRLVADLVEKPSQGDVEQALLLAQDRLLAWGVTGWQDAMVGASNDVPDILPAYLELARSGRLRARVVGALWWDRTRGLEQIEELVEKRARAAEAGFRAEAVKIMQDGVAENFTAGMLEPYLDGCGCVTANSGKSFVPPELLAEASVRLDALGFQLHFHALGDRAVRESLDAVAAARAANGEHDHRHTLAHLQVVHPDDVPRFAELGVVANLQPYWACHEPQMDELTVPFLGAERARHQYPFGALHRSGARLASGSDWPVSTADPLAIVHVAVNRALVEADGGYAEAFLGEQALSLADAITAHTAGTAYLNHDEEHSGELVAGKVADVVVLDRDPFEHPLAEVGLTEVAHTLVGGEVVHSRDAR
ncbi:amidohydrolase [Nocardioides mangrovicus]|uniref:Amidohydrolase n=1 Tax=Nocardioides mangrovicus TaxID=2478913 RepID=A0A3L8P1V9_9ACTN|nr:amidohydrolase [Nocardioides mangrovicus]RLV49410.1 amidohydrolase [Nocardioides mangrovicus]